MTADELDNAGNEACERKDFAEAQLLWDAADKQRDRETSQQARSFNWRNEIAARVTAAAAEVLP